MSRRPARPSLVCLVTALVLALSAGAPAFAATGLDRATSAVVAITAGADIIGSGVVVAPGRVLTAGHVINDGAGTEMRLLTGNVLVPFKVVAEDRSRDLALLSAGLPDVTPIVWGDSASLQRGDDVVALGFPIGLRSVSLTKGVVSSPLQDFRGAAFIQTDAAINPGNSGGALVDTSGRLVGINVAKIAAASVDRIGFAVPEADALVFVRRAAPGAELSLADASDQGGSDLPEQIAVFGAVLFVLLAAYALIGRRIVAPKGATRPAGAGLSPESAAPGGELARPAYSFRVAGPHAIETLMVVLPAVVGHSPDADVRVLDQSVSAFEVRLEPGPGDTVVALDLTDSDGMYCGESCVKRVSLVPGMSVRVGATEVTLLSGGEDGR